MSADPNREHNGGGVAASQRFRSSQRCPICGGWATTRSGRAERCWGFLARDGAIAICTREERGGVLREYAPGQFAHVVAGDCRCGIAHAEPGAVVAQRMLERESGAASADRAEEWALRIWRNARAPEGTPVDAYLRSRGLTGPIPPSIRFAVIGHRPSGRTLAAMVAGATCYPSTRPSCVQRTYLTEGGRKANVVPQKMTLGKLLGKAVQLAPAGSTVIVAEGIESALSVQLATGHPAWAALGCMNLPNVALPPPPLAAEVIVACDNDDHGESLRAARLAAKRWVAEGRRVRIALPPAHTDFNDVLCAP